MALTKIELEHGRIEDLAKALVDEMKKERQKKGRFEFLKVAVVNPNLGSWLKMKVFAKEPELSAGIEMPFLEKELERILKENCKPGLEIVSGQDYPRMILNILMKDGRNEFAPFRKYIKEKEEAGPLTIVSQREALKAVQLANRLGQLIDDYEATGYLELLEEKKNESDIFKGEWALVEALKDVQSFRKVFDAVKNTPPKGEPEKIILFGHTTLTDLQYKILDWIAQTHEVIWYCPKYEIKPSGNVNVSVSVIPAPGIRREVEIVYDKILNLVWDHNDEDKPVKKDGINFSDIAVLVADLPKYRPIIESVFEGRDQIPFGLIGTSSSDYSSYLDGFLALMDIARHGLNRTRLFAVLNNPCVQNRMGFSQENVDVWRDFTKRLGAYDGFEQADNNVHNASGRFNLTPLQQAGQQISEDGFEHNASGRFNWSWALKRLRLGLVAERLGNMELEALDNGEVEKFSEIVETLHRRLSALDKVNKALCSSKDEKVWPETWAGRLHDIMDEFLAANKEDSLETQVRANIVRTLNSLDVIEGEQGFRLPVAFVESTVAGMECAKGEFLRHGVTIGGLRSLAHVPFKYLFVMGLSAGTLPGKNDHSTLDVRNELPDAARKDNENLHTAKERANFEAAVSSARKELVLSYSRLDLQTDEKLYPSSLVYEAASSINIENYEKKYSLEHLSHSSDEVGEGNTLPPATAEGGMEIRMPSAKDLAAFVRDPFNGLFARRFKVALEKYRMPDFQVSSPLGIGGETLWDLQKAMILRELDENYEKSKSSAKIPDGFLGDFAKLKLEKSQQWIDAIINDEDRELLRDPSNSDKIALLCRSYNQKNIDIPPSVVLETFFDFLLRYEASTETKNCEFSIRIINFDKVVQTWKWDLSRDIVISYLGKVRECYNYNQIYPSVTYDELRECLKNLDAVPNDNDGWDRIVNVLKEIKDKEWYKTNNKGLVIDKVLDKYRQEATREKLLEMFEDLFDLPMSGILVETRPETKTETTTETATRAEEAEEA